MATDNTLSLSTVTATIHAPIDKVNLADWILHLPDAEYQRCSTAHLAAGATTSEDGRPMSINTTSPKCTSQTIATTKVQVVWELSVKKVDESTCEYTNHIHGSATEETLQFLNKHGITLEAAHAARQQASHAHNLEETPKFARSIEKHALRII
jgi:hypothetical protein